VFAVTPLSIAGAFVGGSARLALWGRRSRST
jgi:hypothetical protein